jgi:uncharacterized protein (DUF2141 family)
MKLSLTGLFAVLALSAYSQIKFEVTVTGIKDTNGTIRVGLFSSEEEFLENAVYGEVVKATGSKVTVVFNSLPPGQYGISVIHDENENGELDSNFMGIPKEGFGFGNNAMGMFGPPSFKEASIKIDPTHQTHEIKLKYM